MAALIATVGPGRIGTATHLLKPVTDHPPNTRVDIEGLRLLVERRRKAKYHYALVANETLEALLNELEALWRR